MNFSTNILKKSIIIKLNFVNVTKIDLKKNIDRIAKINF